MPRNVLVTAGVALFVGLVLVVGLTLARSQEGRGVDEANPAVTPDPESQDLDVRVTRGGFEPQRLQVRVEQVVRWRNESGEPMRVEVVPDQRGATRVQGLGSAPIASGASHAFRPPVAGTYRYRSSADSAETGVIEAR